jgi:Mce-associated membrane protein
MVVRGVVLTIVLLASGAAAQESNVSGPENRAFADRAATTEVTGQAKTAMAALFTYSWFDLDPWHTAVRTWATGDAARKLESQLGASLGAVNEQHAILTSSVVDLAVRDLRGDRAQLLVFLNTRTERRTGTPTVTGSNVIIQMQRGPQRWQVVDIEVPR